MTALRRIAIGFVVLLALMLGAAWAVPPWLAWDRYRDDVAGLASAVLGQTVRIDGAITLRVLPEPLLVAERVSVMGGAAAASITADQLLLRVALGPLVAGRVDARELVLRGVEIRLPWPLDPAALTLRAPSWLSALSARIERGRLWLGELEVSGLEANLATHEVSGSFVSAGRARGGGRDWMFTARVSRPGGDGAVGIDVTLDGQGAVQGVGAVVSGQMQGDGTLLGRIDVRGPDLSRLMPAPGVPFRAEGRLSAADGLVVADELAGELAGSPIQGAVALRLMPQLRLDVALIASRLDLDGWLPALLKAAEGGGWEGLPLAIDLSAEAATLGGGTVRGLRGGVDIVRGAVTVRETRAVLPGDAGLRVAGRAARVAARVAAGGRPGGGRGARWRFDGDARLEAPALRTTMAWAATAGLGPIDGLPTGVLQRASLGGKLAVEAGELTLSGVAGVLDGSEVAADLAWRPAPRPSLRAVLAVERLALDPWLAGGWPDLPAVAGLFGGLSLDVQLAATRAEWLGAALSRLVLVGNAEPGRVSVQRLEVAGLGATMAASGTVLEGGRVVDGRVDIRAEQAAGLAPVLAPVLAAIAGPVAAGRLAPLLRGRAVLAAQASGAAEALGLKLAGELGDLKFEATPVIDVAAGRWAGRLALLHPGAPRLGEMLGLAGAAAWLGDGSFGLQAQMVGGPERIAAERFDLAAGGLRASGALGLARGAVPKLSGRVVADSVPLPWLNPRSPDPLPLEALLGWAADVQVVVQRLMVAQATLLEEVQTSVTLAGGRLELGGLLARLAGGTLTGALSYDVVARPPALMVQANLVGAVVSGPVFDAALDVTSGTLDIAARLSAAGSSPAGLLAGLGGRLAVAGRDGVLAGIDLGRMGARLQEDDLRAALAGGSTGFARLVLEGDVERGGLVLSRAWLSGDAGTVTASGTVDFGRALLALRLAVVPGVLDAPEIGLRLSGPVDAPERVPELAGAIRWRAEHP